MEYEYTVATAENKIEKGIIEAESEERAEAALYEAGFSRVLRLKVSVTRKGLEAMLPSLFGVRRQDVIDFSYQLADLVASGVDILSALQLLEKQAAKNVIRKTITGLIQELHNGRVLSEALGRYPETFPETYCSVIRMSEHTGNLEAGLRQMGHYLQNQMDERSRVQRAAAYPALVLTMALGVLVLLVTVVLPPLTSLFASFDVELPLVTRLLVGATDFVVDNKLPLLVLVLAVTAALLVYPRTQQGRRTLDRLMLSMPLIGPLNVDRNMGQICRRMSMLLEAGLPLPEVMSATIQTVSNTILAPALEEVREGSIQGDGLAEPMSRNPLFPLLMVSRVEVAENTGSLESTLASLADFYESKADRRITGLISVIEPTMTIVIGLTVGFLALSIVTPLYSILHSV